MFAIRTGMVFLSKEQKNEKDSSFGALRRMEVLVKVSFNGGGNLYVRLREKGSGFTATSN
jgi:hypothetical protein